MDLEEFREEVINRINEENQEPGERRDAFLSEVVSDLYDSGECLGFDQCIFEGTGTNNRKIEVDGYYFDEDDGTLCLFLCRYVGGDRAEVMTKTDIEKLFNRAKYFVEGAFDGSILQGMEEGTPSCYAAIRIGSLRSTIERFRFFIITDGVRGEREIKNLDVDDIDDNPTILRFFDIQEYFGLKKSKVSQENTEIVFDNYGFEGIQCIHANELSSDSEYEAYLCIMPGKLLSDIYSKHGGRLLESNVRSFLSTKKKVNKGIRATILSQPTRFFAYNNGISATATSVKVINTKNGALMTAITAFQIVNGGQTTALINAADRSTKDHADINSVFVPMKICVIQEGRSTEMTQYISEYSNSQNSISSADFFSNKPFHVKFEQISRRIIAPPQHGTIRSTKWYYERARGSYLQEQAMLKPSEKKEFLSINPKNQCITKTDLAKYWNTYHMKPHIVSKGTSYSIKEYAEIVDKLWESTSLTGTAGAKVNDNYFKETVAITLLFRDLEKSISNKELAPWYNSGYRANLVTYAISKLVSMLEEKGGSIDLMKLWKEQTVPDSLRKQLLDISEQILQIINDPKRDVDDVREWCKKPACWMNIKGIEMSINRDIGSYVVSQRKEAGQQRRATRDEREKTGDEIWREVVEKGEEFWRNVLIWGTEHGELSRDEQSVLRSALSISSGKGPSQKQAAWIWKIYEKLRGLGYSA